MDNKSPKCYDSPQIPKINSPLEVHDTNNTASKASGGYRLIRFSTVSLMDFDWWYLFQFLPASLEVRDFLFLPFPNMLKFSLSLYLWQNDETQQENDDASIASQDMIPSDDSDAKISFLTIQEVLRSICLGGSSSSSFPDSLPVPFPCPRRRGVSGRVQTILIFGWKTDSSSVDKLSSSKSQNTSMWSG